MKKFKLIINDFEIYFNNNNYYLFEGWCIKYKGVYLSKFEKSLLRALYEAYIVYKEIKYER